MAQGRASVLEPRILASNTAEAKFFDTVHLTLVFESVAEKVSGLELETTESNLVPD